MKISPEDQKMLKELENKLWHHELALCIVLGVTDLVLLVIAVNFLSALMTVMKPILLFAFIVFLVIALFVTIGFFRMRAKVREKRDSENSD